MRRLAVVHTRPALGTGREQPLRYPKTVLVVSLAAVALGGYKAGRLEDQWLLDAIVRTSLYSFSRRASFSKIGDSSIRSRWTSRASPFCGAPEELAEFGCATLEEHLLICQSCRDRLEFTDQYVAAIKAAAGKIRESGKGE